MNYWLARDGQKCGPYTLEALERMAAEGNAAPTDFIWREGMANWTPLAQVINLPAPPPPPPAFPQGWPQAQPYPQPYPQPYQEPAPGLIGASFGIVVPPSLSWGVLLLLTFVTFGVFPFIWYFVQAGFVQKLERGSQAVVFGVLGLVSMFLAGATRGMAFASQASSDFQPTSVGLLGMGGILQLAGWTFFILGVFRIRQAMLNYYNLAEPINLRLSGALTFFFGIFYLQYHMSRIAQWKRTGFLPLQ